MDVCGASVASHRGEDVFDEEGADTAHVVALVVAAGEDDDEVVFGDHHERLSAPSGPEIRVDCHGFGVECATEPVEAVFTAPYVPLWAGASGQDRSVAHECRDVWGLPVGYDQGVSGR